MNKAKRELTQRLQNMNLAERKVWMTKNWRTLNRVFSYGGRDKGYTQYLGKAMNWLEKNPEFYDNFSKRSYAKFLERQERKRQGHISRES